MGTASMEKRVVSLGIGIMNRASTTETAASSAQDTSVRTFCRPWRGADCAADTFLDKLDIKKPPIVSMGGGLNDMDFQTRKKLLYNFSLL